MAADQIEIQIPRPLVEEGSALTATAYFRDRATKAATTPTTVQYRLDCLSTCTVIADWTTATPGTSVSIPVTGPQNEIISDSNEREVKQLTVMADEGLVTQYRQSIRWRVENIYGSP